MVVCTNIIFGIHNTSTDDFLDPSFQILHAFHILERTLLEFKKRSAEFEIVFWTGSLVFSDLVDVANLKFKQTVMQHCEREKIASLWLHVF